MEILAYFIEKHFLFNHPEFFNLGGEYLFHFELKDKKLEISKTKNPKYVKEFFGKKISNISAIVGNNGVGKSSIFKILNQEPSHPLISIYHNNSNIFIRNQSELEISADFEYSKYDSLEHYEGLFPLYYSNHIDYNLKLIPSPVNQTNYFKESLEDYYFDSILRQMFFLNQKGQFLQKQFENLPYYEELAITVNNISKSQFLNNDFYRDATIGKSIKQQLEMLWSYYGVNEEGKIHSDEDFIKNFEIFILSLLVTDDRAARTNSNGLKFGFQDVLNEVDFEEKLTVFLKKRLDNIDGPEFETLNETLGISFENIHDLIRRIKANKIIQISGGFDYNRIKGHLEQTIIRYHRIFKLYRFIASNRDRIIHSQKSDTLNISIRENTSEDFLKSFIELYQDVHETMQYINFEFRIFNISPTKRLSTGELSLLNFYSSLYSFVRKGEHHFRKHKNYLLLLDEPETGYHAVWKKKFILSITQLLPELFSELKQNPSIQILFSTHDALTLSDIPNDNITYLKKLNDSSVKVFKIEDKGRPLKSFGANITDLLADSFFVEDGLIGDFAKKKIDKTIDWLRSKEKKNPERYLQIINLIDEPIIREKLLEMYSEKMTVDVLKKYKKEEIKRLLEEFNNQYGEQI
ncbi:MAG: AAA family ATPase [Leeuwenhoekiella sp.]|uniref:AAA family ATPase n=1 Tax=Leeuwenhoekiella sp. TaxID=1977054 RepID=UPI000EEC59D6|nr:hypothetical protein [Leeuwenhoekiella sp.]|tara:strand:+ start:1809 stop:3710 length:1902 start_codon:yes stop_codon:yes gene_type:complete